MFRIITIKSGFLAARRCLVLSGILLALASCARHGSVQERSLLSLPDVPAVQQAVETAKVIKKQSDVPAADSVSNWYGKTIEQLDALLADTLLQTSQLGLCIYDLTDNKLVFAHGAQQRLRPASTQKVITAVTALARLGTDYNYTTSLWIDGSIQKGVLCGNIYVVGGFDPAFDSEDMRAFVQALRNQGIRSVKGKCFADLSMKDTLSLGWGWCWDDDNPVLSPLLYQGKDNFFEHFKRIAKLERIQPFAAYGGVRRRPENARLLLERTRTIDQVLLRMMKESDNLYAESLFYQLAALEGRMGAGRKQAVQNINDFISELGLNPTRYKIADGSGLSLYNYATAEMQVAFLRYAFAHAPIYKHFLPSLPIAGEDGTLRNRMQGTKACGRVFAKTGTLTGVYSLCGYAEASNGHVLAFSILNQGASSARPARDFQDSVCKILCE